MLLRAVAPRLRAATWTLSHGARWASTGADGVADLATASDVDAAIAATATGLPLLLNFTAKWCGPCRAAAPRIDALAASHAGKATFARVDIDSDEVLRAVAEAGVTAVPTFQLYVGAKRVAEVRGADLAALEAALKEMV